MFVGVVNLVCLVHLVDLVCLVGMVDLGYNKRSNIKVSWGLLRLVPSIEG